MPTRSSIDSPDQMTFDPRRSRHDFNLAPGQIPRVPVVSQARLIRRVHWRGPPAGGLSGARDPTFDADLARCWARRHDAHRAGAFQPGGWVIARAGMERLRVGVAKLQSLGSLPCDK